MDGAAQSFSGMFTYRTQSLELSGAGDPQRLVGARVAPGLFPVLGIAPVVGRALTEEDDQQNAKVVVLDYGVWTRAFGRDPLVVGRTHLARSAAVHGGRRHGGALRIPAARRRTQFRARVAVPADRVHTVRTAGVGLDVQQHAGRADETGRHD